MKIIKVDATPSTNSFLKELLRKQNIIKPTCVWTKAQTNGRGQRGSKWQSESGKNLTFSVFFVTNEAIKATPFVLNMLTTLSIKKVLNRYNLPQLKIKWPNDILSANKKIGGILIENSYQNGVLSETVIGVGININQEDFTGLPKASSVKNLIGISLSLEGILDEILNSLETFFKNYQEEDFEKVKRDFEAVLFRNKKPSTFEVSGNQFVGIIQGVSNGGLLKVLQQDNCLNYYDVKEIALKY
ncbi:biotin--[acetyl-CoA-carboxylase] ligase [Aquimarina agarivorans]|uniref:biotin--[acetyl-CoA-carboxylase] ligase n=1 Tax=Aquimarina agarivorans TaxID=980584 RepID=UPI000248EBA5|nr:biotin--[acetyl-CoA-carboxylase] ligase [Aquimarina agarivorans]